MANLYFEATLDADQLKRELRDVNNRINGFTQQAKQQGAEMDSTFKRIGAAMAGYFSFAAAKGFISQMVQVRGEFQQLEIAMESIIGNKARADQLMSDVIEMAAKTPFSLAEVGQGAKQLLAVQEPVDEVMNSLRQLGDISAGLSVPLSQLIKAYGDVRAKGRLMGQEMLQFMNAGVPIVAELAKHMDVAESEVSDLVAKGKVGFNDLKAVISNLSDEGGMFYNLMEKQSSSLTGRLSNLGDSWEQMLNKLGESNEGILYAGIEGLNSLVENYETVLDVLKAIVVTYGAYKGAVVLLHMAEKARNISGAISAWFSLAKGIKTAKDAQLAFNLATKMNPLGLAAAGVAALVAAITLFANKTKSAQDIIADLNESVSKFSDSGKEVERLAGEYETLRGKAERTKDENDRLNTVMEALSKSVPGVVTEFDEYGRVLDVNIEKVREFSEAQKEAAKIQLTKQIEEAQKAVEKLDNKLAPLQRVFQEGITSSTIATATGGTRTIERRANEDEIAKAAERANKIYSEREQILESIAQAQNALNNLTAEPPKTEPQKTEEEAPANVLEAFKKGLEERKKAYDDYNDAVRNARDEDKAAVKGYYSELIKDGNTYKEYLEGLLRDSRNNVEATTAIYLAAAKANIDLIDDRPDPIKGKPRMSPIEAITPGPADTKALEAAVQRYEKIYSIIRDITKTSMNIELAENLIDSAYAAQDVARAVSEIDADLGSALMKVADLIGGVGNVIGTLNDSNASGFQKVSGIISLAITAGGELAKIRQGWQNEEVNAQMALNKSLASQLDMEAEINNLRRERAKQELYQSAFLDPNFKKQYESALDVMGDSKKQMDEALGTLMQNAVFTAEGSAKRRLFGTKTDNYSFGIGQILGDYMADYAGEGWQDLLFGQLNVGLKNKSFKDFLGGLLDPAGIFGGYADRKAQGNALGKLRDAFNDTFAAMGKTSADIARMSSEEWADFFSLMDEMGYITDEGTKRMVENAKAAAEEYAQAMEEMKGIIKSVAGDLGTSLESTLVDAFKNGSDAAMDFKDVVNDVLQSLFMKEIITPYFQSYFDKLQSEMQSSMDGGDGSWMDDIMRFSENVGPAFGGAIDLMKDFDKAMQEAGFDGFSAGAADAADASLSGAIKGVSEETASILAGQMNAIRINQAESLRLMNESARYWAEIAANTSYNRYLEGIHS
ncbi:MAG TPA: tape measure protein, partial [Bacillota bacterium]|nr:tape measure protein [Bacillota bacterium]